MAEQGLAAARWRETERPRLRLDEVLARAAAIAPEAQAASDSNRRPSFAELDRLVDVLAGQLSAAGVGAGVRVGLAMQTTIEGIALLYAVSRAGGVSVPLNPYWEVPEVADALRRSSASALLAVSAGNAAVPVATVAARELGLPIGEVSDQTIAWQGTLAPAAGDVGADEAIILFTSGSTAQPKGAILEHQALVGVAHYYSRAFDFTDRDRYLVLMPIYHVGGIVDGILAPHLGCAASVCLAKFDPEAVLAAMEGEAITCTAAFDSMFHKILTAPGYRPERHRTLCKVSGGETEAGYERLLAMGIEEVYPSYGLTEVASGLSIAGPDRSVAAWRGTVGRPAPGLEVVVVDPDTDAVLEAGETGEIRVRGWAVSPGYLGGDSGRDAHGYLRTGDLGSFDPDGALRFRGRLKRMIKTGGENVSSFEVEKTVLEHADWVRQILVVGVPDPEWTEMVVALVEFHEGQPRGVPELKDLLRERLAGYKRPKHYLELTSDQWLLLPAGKTDVGAMTALAASLLDRASDERQQ